MKKKNKMEWKNEIEPRTVELKCICSQKEMKFTKKKKNKSQIYTQ